MYALVLGLAWMAVTVLGYAAPVMFQAERRRYAAPAFVISLAVLAWVAGAAVSASALHGPVPQSGWTQLDQIVRDWLVRPAALAAILSPLFVAALFSSGQALFNIATYSWARWTAAVLAFLFAPMGLLACIYIGCTLAGACF